VLTSGSYAETCDAAGPASFLKGGFQWFTEKGGSQWGHSFEAQRRGACAALLSDWFLERMPVKVRIGPPQEMECPSVAVLTVPSPVRDSRFLSPGDVCNRALQILARADAERQQLIDEEAAQGLVFE
jgi:hypothetical protein